ncbi:hypothetical protein BJ138DRAFT_995188 [Hygrophoropsis aurantiaca]|uniref:Uncharacterized protein n=1 Tax=Hygrophoropsis aurantiaca TaxID=72124 RepID=A0ACB8ATL8_9AGAM|nr:hypothetical protein BJ138DRAFT_995188 [Hygrophoropsis aurantiaca]
MATAHHPNHRASLLNGLRTGGVRSASMNVPHTAAPGGSFNIPRFASNSMQYCSSPVEEDMDEVGELFSQNLYINNNNPTYPMTAAVDGPNRFMQQQQMGGSRPLNPNSMPFNPSYPSSVRAQAPVDPQVQAYQQMQMMQMELLRLQSAQAQRSQQVQAAVLAEALRQQVNQNRRASSSANPPATAGPLNTTFDMHSNANAVPARRPSQAELLKAQLGVSSSPPIEEQVPMTAALGGRFGSRPTASIAFPKSSQDVFDFPQSYSPPGQTTVISGGTSLGSLASNNANSSGSGTPSKSDSAVSWRRGGANNSVLSGLRAVSTSVSPSVKITPPPGERLSPPLVNTNKARPRPLSFSAAPLRSLPVVVAVDSSVESEYEDASSSASSQSNPTTPHSPSSLDTPLSPREEATKKLYEGLGMGRPAPPTTHAIVLPSIANMRLASQPMRQPRGPPSGTDELGPKNFATRIRRKAIGGLGVLMGARERRETIEVY